MQRLRALVVDDSLTVRMDLRRTLSNAGFLVSACSTKMVAMASLNSGAFDLSVLDVNLPDGSGIEILQAIKCNPRLADMKIILLTAQAAVPARLRGLAMGADLFVGKPYDCVYVARQARELCRQSKGEAAGKIQRWESCRKLLLIGVAASVWPPWAADLRQDGHDLVLAGSEQEALALLSVEPFACVVIEIWKSSSVEVCRRLRQAPGGEALAIVVVSMQLESGQREQALTAGADEFIDEVEGVLPRMRELLIKRHRAPPRSKVSPT